MMLFCVGFSCCERASVRIVIADRKGLCTASRHATSSRNQCEFQKRINVDTNKDAKPGLINSDIIICNGKPL